MSAPLVVAVVLNWNLPDDTIRCVRSLLAGDYAALRVLIVDNGSTDDSLARFARELPEIEVLASGQNLFYGAGNNIGIRAALAQDAVWVLVLNNDTVVARDMLSELVNAAEDTQAGLVAPVIYYLDRPDDLWDAGLFWPRWLPWPYKARARDKPYPVDLVTGCGVLLRADLAARTGGFDERYVMYYEDSDLSLRLGRLGATIYVIPRAQMWHAAGRTAALTSASSARQKAHYRLRFYRAWAPWPWRPLTLTAVTGRLLARALGALVRGRAEIARAMLWGCLGGWREPIEDVPNDR